MTYATHPLSELLRFVCAQNWCFGIIASMGTVSDRIQQGLLGVAYTVVALTSVYVTFDAFHSGRCFLLTDSLPMPVCRGGIQATTLFSGIFPATAFFCAQKAQNCFTTFLFG